MTRQEKWLVFAFFLAIVIAGIAVVKDSAILLASVNSILTIGLIGFTYMYVKHTKELVDKADEQKQAMIQGTIKADEQKQVMIEGNINIVAPLIELRLWRAQPPSIGEFAEIEFRNIGRGPALQFRAWIEFGEGPLFRSKAFFVQLIPSDGKWRRTPSIQGEVQGEWVGTVSPKVRAQYHGTFGERKTYESFLVFPANAPPTLEFGVATEFVFENLRWLSLEQSTAEDEHIF